jgi:26S proteasome regulatory subunit T3
MKGFVGNLLTGPDRSLKRELVRAQEEIKRIQSVPLVIGQFMEAIDQKYDNIFFTVGISCC